MRLRPLQGPTQRGPPTSSTSCSEKQTTGSIGNSHGVSSPTTLEPERVHFTPGCHPDYVPSSGFLTLSTVSSSLGRPALFHAGNAHGVRPSGVFPHCQVLRLVTRELPSWRSSTHCGVNSATGRPISASPIIGAHVTSLSRLQGLAPTVNPYRCWTVTS